jgi:branched-chain amino acid transport system substrate-binding protein
MMPQEEAAMKKSALCTAIFLVTLVVLVGVGVNSSYPAEKAPYVIGLIDALTGQYAPLGNDARKAEDIAIEEINSAGGVNGHPLKIISYDDESQPPKAADLVRKLKDQGVIAIIGGQGFPLASASCIVANEEKVPFLSKCTMALPLEKGNPGSYVFGPPIYELDFLVDRWVRLLVKDGGRRIALLVTSDPMGETYKKMLTELKEKNPDLFELVGTEWMLTTDVDITPQLTKLKALKPDALFVAPSGRPATVAYKTLDLMDWNVLAISSSANSQTAFVDSVKGFSHRVRIALPAAGLRPDTIPEDDPGDVQGLRKIVNKFKKETGKILFDGALSPYDDLYCLADAIAKLGLDPEKQNLQEMRDKIRQGLENQTYQGKLVFVQRTPENHRGAAKTRFYEAKIEGDWFVPVRWMDYPAMTEGKIAEPK